GRGTGRQPEVDREKQVALTPRRSPAIAFSFSESADFADLTGDAAQFAPPVARPSRLRHRLRRLDGRGAARTGVSEGPATAGSAGSARIRRGPGGVTRIERRAAPAAACAGSAATRHRPPRRR